MKDLATANALLAQIKSGASFADVARTSSTDSGSATNGGSLGCLRKQAYVKEFETAAYAAQFDVPTQPVKSQYGYHIILVTHPTLAAVRSELTQALQQNPTGLLRELRMQSMKVWINPQFGSGALVVDSQQGQLTYQVTPPPAPAVRTHREKDTTTTTATTTTQPAGG